MHVTACLWMDFMPPCQLPLRDPDQLGMPWTRRTADDGSRGSSCSSRPTPTNFPNLVRLQQSHGLAHQRALACSKTAAYQAERCSQQVPNKKLHVLRGCERAVRVQGFRSG